jgi:hypothetical protein
MVYEETPEKMRELVDAKVDSQFTRAMRYVEAVDARAVVPSAGPPAFLDPDLWFANVIKGDELSIFPDQRSFMERLAAVGREGILAIPGTEIEFGHSGAFTITHPMPQADVDAIFADKEQYLRDYQADWLPWLEDMKAKWLPASPDLLATLKAWWEPLMAMAPTLCDASARCACCTPATWPWPSTSPTARCASGRARRTPSASTSSANWWRPWWRSGPTTGATHCSCPAGSPPGARARSTSTSTTSSSRCRWNACAAPRPKPCASTTPTAARLPPKSSSWAATSSSAPARTARPT